MGKAYSLLWKQCTTELQDSFEARPDYHTDIKKNAINLLNAVEEHSLSYEETRYDMSTISDAVRTLFNIRQKEDEGLVAYTSRFKTIRNITVN
jgi:hypothetical protein